MTTPSKQLQNPTGWHHKPSGSAGPCCSICGLASARRPGLSCHRLGEHRATAEDENIDAIWIKRRKHEGDWRFTDVGSRRVESKKATPPTGITKATLVLARGGGFKEAAKAAGVSIATIDEWSDRHRVAWFQAYAQAVSNVDPNQWHRRPRNSRHGSCPVCGVEGKGEHRVGGSRIRTWFVTDGNGGSQVVRRNRNARATRTINRQPSGPSGKVVQGMTTATFALATGATLDEAAKSADVSRAAMRDWKRSHPGQWDALYSNAMKQVVETVRSVAGTDAVLEDPDHIIKLKFPRISGL